MIFSIFSYLDFSYRGQIGFQDASTSIMQGIINLHHHICFLLVIVLITVFTIFYKMFKISVWSFKKEVIKNLNNLNFFFFNKNKLFNFNNYFITNIFYNRWDFIKKLQKSYNLDIYHGTFLEVVWTIIPSLILLVIVGPSFALLYAMDSAIYPEQSIKIIGHQWYWSYEYNDCFVKKGFCGLTSPEVINLFAKYYAKEEVSLLVQDTINKSEVIMNYNFDSYILPTVDLVKGDLRLLEVDWSLYMPVFVKIRLDITSEDVIHSFAVPSLGIKVDAVPGRLNAAYVELLREGVYFGQCSELCGVQHGYMPIKIIVVDLKSYMDIKVYDFMTDALLLNSDLDFTDLFKLILITGEKVQDIISTPYFNFKA